MISDTILIGPFTQLLTMDSLPIKGALKDEQLPIIPHAGIWVENGVVADIGPFQELKIRAQEEKINIHTQTENAVCLPGYMDCHTHIAFGGNRSNDFALRNAGSSYLEIAKSGGGIWNTVSHTRELDFDQLVKNIVVRSQYLLRQGITTIEVKTGYGLNVKEEYRLLKAIQAANEQTSADLISTCLAAHTFPKDFNGTAEQYLEMITQELLPLMHVERLGNRVDAFIETTAFSSEQVRPYFEKAKQYGFDITVHADQFTTSGSTIAVEYNAVSADHLEASTDKEIQLLAFSNTVAVALPAASIGIGCSFTPARKLLDAGASLAIATDWNPGSAPMGQLVTSASVLATMEKLTNAEILSAITFRAAKALNLNNCGVLRKGASADFIVYHTDNYQNITYFQGSLQPHSVWKAGRLVHSKNNSHDF